VFGEWVFDVEGAFWMSVFAALLMLIPPALVPYGPIKGQFECLFEFDTGSQTAFMKFDESGPTYNDLPLQAAIQGMQVDLQQFPLDGNQIEYVEFGAGGVISILAKNTKKPMGQFTFIKMGRDESQWMKFSVPIATGEMKQLGTCFGRVMGRLDRPVRFTKITLSRID
jgi:hypothetical protein